jgi:hypothetical protein
MSASIAARISTLPIRCLVDQRWGGTRSRFYAWHNPRALEHSIAQSASLEETLMIARGPFPLIRRSYAPDWSRTDCSSWKLIGLTR